MMETGTVKWFNPEKGIGFINKSKGGDIYVHISGVPSKAIGLKEGDEVSFFVTETERGPRATQVQVLRRQPAPLRLVRKPYVQRHD